MKPYENPRPSLNVGNKSVEEENSYTSEDDVYFVFIDVLGFKNNYKNNKNIYEKVFLFYLDLLSGPNYILGNPDEYYVGQTSDSLYFYTLRCDYLMNFLKIYAYFSLYAMCQNVFFRGGISKGTLSRKAKHQFYGDNVINSYLLESSIATYPRIMIDENTYSDIKELGELNDLFKDDDGRHYFKPFAYFDIKDEIDRILQSYSVNLVGKSFDKKDLSIIIDNNLNEFQYDNKTYRKFRFLKEQYDNIK